MKLFVIYQTNYTPTGGDDFADERVSIYAVFKSETLANEEYQRLIKKQESRTAFDPTYDLDDIETRD